ncbi:tetratricopeptide repeat protein [Microbulbifer sp. GL-2]|uniref:tetratricopeptide repeat protein n=1 Tax=Microbulbifer sp. GL-2 TaxID=2591606 RepID=UPI0011621AC4|nr:tetratricopeptide repeat protein [Microbulbifer sp. GL-2]BBM03091.1 hypothetical protein GL2_31650 [Microbulbifer sp. GL-2]
MINIDSSTYRFHILLSVLVLTACGTDISSIRKVDTSSSEFNVETNLAYETSSKPPTYVGSNLCAKCHQKENTAWQSSHHALAMLEASDSSILGNFNDSTFTYEGVTSTFFKKGEIYYVKTDGIDGKLQEFPIAYTFGVEPLQQYLIEIPGGRLQALSIVWDTRAKSKGGQRWFHLYPNENIIHTDSLHWMGINQNWNFMCADCHSTNLQKNYDLKTDIFNTTWSEINIGCESCHGPASRHLEWVQNKQKKYGDFGFSIKLNQVRTANWDMDFEKGIAKNRVTTKHQELQTCAQCHSRRTTFFPGAEAGSQFLDHYNPALLQPPLYHIDGQINEEVYVYGSFLQSKMYAAGVTCSNCHEPHSLQLRGSTDGVCAQCHLPEKFAQTEHHLHPVNSSGAKCVNCHMPAQNYMQVDSRRDHSFRVPRPDLSEKLKTPNACISCHKDKTNQWATVALRKSFSAPSKTHYGEALFAGLHREINAESKLSELITDLNQPAIVRATAVTLLPQYLSRDSVHLLQSVAQSDEPLLSLALAQSLDRVPEQLRPALGIPLLFEKERVTRSLAANALASLPTDSYPSSIQNQHVQALKEYAASELFNSDRPESLVNLGELHRHRGNIQQAEAFYRRAINKAPYYAPAYINLADLYREQGREKDAEQLLRRGLIFVESKASIQHSLGLSLVRQNRHSEAMSYFKESAEASDTHSRFIYVYGIALNSTGKNERALEVLENGLDLYPGSPEILRALVSINKESGNSSMEKKYQSILLDK